VLKHSPLVAQDDNKTNKGFAEFQIAAGNAGWRSHFRFAVHVGWSRVPELWTLGKDESAKSQDENLGVCIYATFRALR
jgi:hypothetical protein